MNTQLIKGVRTWNGPRYHICGQTKKGKNKLIAHGVVKAVALCFATIADENGEDIYPSTETLETWTGYNRKTLYSATKVLLDLNIITLQEKRGKTRRTNAFKFTGLWPSDDTTTTEKRYSPWKIDTDTKPHTATAKKIPNEAKPALIATKPLAGMTPPAIIIKPGRSPDYPTGDYRWISNIEYLRANNAYSKADEADKIKQMTVSHDGAGYLAAGAKLISIP